MDAVGKGGGTLLVSCCRVEEWTPLMKTVDIRTDAGIRDVGLFLRSNTVSPALKKQLQAGWRAAIP